MKKNNTGNEAKTAVFDQKRYDRLNTLSVLLLVGILLGGAFVTVDRRSILAAAVAALLAVGVLLLRLWLRRSALPQQFCPACGSENVTEGARSDDVVSPLTMGIGQNVSNRFTCHHCGHVW